MPLGLVDDVARRVHTFVQHAGDNDAVPPVVECGRQIVEDMRGGAASSRRQFDMEGTDSRPKFVAGP